MEIRDYDPRIGDFPQGDVCIFAIPESIVLVASAIEILPIAGRLIIQEGEATGHHHAIDIPRVRNFRAATTIGDPILNVGNPRLRKAFRAEKSAEPLVGVARLYRDVDAIAQLARCGELTRTDLAIGILVVDYAAVVLTHQEHDGIRLPHQWCDADGNVRRGRYYVGRQVESAGAEERVVLD